MTFCIYMHRNKINNKVYIGQTCSNPPELRWKSGYGYLSSPHFYNAIQKYGWDNFEHIILYENLTVEQSNEIEKELIKKYQSNNPQYGYNIREGGRNGLMAESSKKKISRSKLGHIVSEETRKKISKNHADCKGKNNPNYGNHCSEETKAKIRKNNRSEEKRGVKRPRLTIDKMIQNHPDFSLGNNPRAKSINQYSLNNELLATYTSLREGANAVGLKSTGRISLCCQHKVPSAGGYIWRYADNR